MKMSRIMMKTRIAVGNVRWGVEEKKETRRGRWVFKYLGNGANKFTSPDEVNFPPLGQHGTRDLFLSIVFLGTLQAERSSARPGYPQHFSREVLTITWLSLFAPQHLPGNRLSPRSELPRTFFMTYIHDDYDISTSTM